MALMCNTKGVVHLHGSLGVWRQLRPSNLWRHHTYLNDSSLYSVLTNVLPAD